MLTKLLENRKNHKKCFVYDLKFPMSKLCITKIQKNLQIIVQLENKEAELCSELC